MKNKIHLILKLIVIFTVCLLFQNFRLKPEMTVIKAKFNKNYPHLYPADCFIKFGDRRYLSKQIFKYKNGILTEYWFPGSEGFAVEKLGKNGNDYDKEQKPYRILSFKDNQKFVIFNSKKYEVSMRRNDTIVSKINSENIIVFVKN